MMRRWMLTGLGLIFFTTSALPQENLDEFKNRTINFYHYLAKPDINNFSCKISSDIYINFIKAHGDSTFFYPIKFIWTSEGQGYYVLQALPPQLNDSLRREALNRAQALKNLFEDILYDLHTFYLTPPLEEIPPDANITMTGDTVLISFDFVEDEKTVTIRETYTRGGQLGRMIWKVDDQKVVNYPLYKERKGKWICFGWNSQVYEKDQIVSGMAVRLEYAEVEGNFVPVTFSIYAQQQTGPDQAITSGGYTLFARDYQFNEALNIVPDSSPAAPLPPGK